VSEELYYCIPIIFSDITSLIGPNYLYFIFTETKVIFPEYTVFIARLTCIPLQ